MRQAPDIEVRDAEPLTRGPVTQAGNLVREIRQLLACRFDHPGSSKAPGDHIGDKVGDLHARGKVTVHEEGLRDDEIGSMPAHRGVHEVSVHLADEQVALRSLEFVEDYDALLRRSVVLQEVEKPLEQIGVVLPQAVPGRRMGIGLDDAGERATA